MRNFSWLTIWQILTDMYGDTPWKEACDYTVSMTPAIDKQEEIYKDIMAYVDAAIEDLQKSDLDEPV